MATNIFELDKDDNVDYSEKINIDELFDVKRQNDLKKLELYKRILSRVHTRIKTISRQKGAPRICWFVVPETIIGVPKYDQAGCIAYIMDKLQENGFAVQYFHPNTILISWEHWIPAYVREEYKKRTGIEIDEFGREVPKEDDDDTEKSPDQNGANQQQGKKQGANGKVFKPIDSYKPTGLVYDKSILAKLENRIN